MASKSKTFAVMDPITGGLKFETEEDRKRNEE